MASKQQINLFVPGRLCLFGEHSDWAGMYRTVNSGIVKGAAIVSGIEQGIYATAEKADRFIVCAKRSRTTNTGNAKWIPAGFLPWRRREDTFPMWPGWLPISMTTTASAGSGSRLPGAISPLKAACLPLRQSACWLPEPSISFII